MGERSLLDHLRQRQHANGAVQLAAGGSIELTAGDDLAILAPPPGEKLLIGVDQVVAGVHFEWPGASLLDIGRKVVRRNLSDVAAMAAVPLATLACLTLPRTFTDADAIALYDAIHDEADRFGCPLIGGDTSTHDGPLIASVTILATSGGLTPITRSGAKAGDKLYVTGPLGGSLLGRHLRIEPRLDLARHLAANFDLHAMIDLSDGLSLDATRLAEASGVGIEIDAGRVPIHTDAIMRSQRTGKVPLEHALNDGEDHELLIASPSIEHERVIEIGRVIERDVLLREGNVVRPLRAMGWEHRLARTP